MSHAKADILLGVKTITLTTKPVPINQKYGIINGRNILSAKYRHAKEALTWEIASQWKNEPLEGTVSVNVLQYFGDKRCRDIDAYIKIILDAMSGIVYTDDSQITELHVYKEVDIAAPRVVIQIV